MSEGRRNRYPISGRHTAGHRAAPAARPNTKPIILALAASPYFGNEHVCRQTKQHRRKRTSSGRRQDGHLNVGIISRLRTAPSNLRSVPRMMERPIDPPIDPPSYLPMPATTSPATLSVTVRVTLRAMTCRWRAFRAACRAEDGPTIEPIWPRRHRPDRHPPAQPCRRRASEHSKRIVSTSVSDFLDRACSDDRLALLRRDRPHPRVGGRIMTRSTMAGVPLPSRNDTSASPLPSSVMTCAGPGPDRAGTLRGRLHPF